MVVSTIRIHDPSLDASGGCVVVLREHHAPQVRPNGVTGQAVVAFVCIKESYASKHEELSGLVDELRAWVAQQIGAIARPRDVYLVTELPKTRSGKIMRRLLRDVAEGRDVGDTTTLADTMVMATIKGQVTSK